MKLSSPSPRRWLTLLAVTTVFALGACASKSPMPVGAMATARSAITQAESAGAAQSAPVELLAARDKLVRAEAAIREERFAAASMLAEKAAADAELAERKTRAAKAQEAARELQRSNETLESETKRTPK